MKIDYKGIVPWGRSYEEYVRMFALSGGDLASRVLDCGGGPSAFNAEMARRGGSAVSVDPIYGLSAAEVRKRLDETCDDVVAQTRANRDKFVWRSFASVEELKRVRMAAMEQFLTDFERGRDQGRYVQARAPELPFGDRAFDLALSSHFLFLYSADMSLQEHRRAVDEMLRVAREVRIFPLLDLNASPSPHVEPLMQEKLEQGFDVYIVKVDYEFQKGGSRMLRIARG